MRIYFEALSKIPKKFIHNGTKCTTYGKNMVVMCNPNFQPMTYTRKNGWKKIKLSCDYDTKNLTVR